MKEWLLLNKKKQISLYTSIPHPKLKSRLKELVKNSFRAKSGKRRYSYIVVHGLNAYFVKDHTN